MRTFVIGDIHGGNKALEQCLERSAFDMQRDQLISLGDICDGWPETDKCFEALTKIKRLTVVMGNHDWWLQQWVVHGSADISWLGNGGQNTVNCYPNGMPEAHVQILHNMQPYHVQDNRLFVHAGINPSVELEDQDEHTLMWDRQFVHAAFNDDSGQLTRFDEVYIGHTPIHRFGYSKPIKKAEVWLMDTGAAWGEKLTMMNVDTKEIFQSDRTVEMYPEGSGRA